MSDTTPRLALPLLAAGQAQKEIFHNEALALIDCLVQPVVESASLSQPPASPASGACWIVGEAPSSAWAGQENALACWTEGGWRFFSPFTGLMVWNQENATRSVYIGPAWSHGVLYATAISVGGQQVVGAQATGIADPAGGTMIDVEARFALAALLEALREHGLIAN